MPLSIANFFRNIHFLSHFHYFWQSDRFVKFPVNTDFLINQQKNIFTQHTSHPSLISRENLRSLWHKFLETSTFYHIFAIFHLMFAIFSINFDLNVNSKILIFLQKRRYISLSFRKRIGVFRCKNFSKHPFFTTFSLFLIILINTDFLIDQLKRYFYTRQLTPLIHLGKEVTLSVAEVFRNIIHFLSFF